jgi:hypothetical protein
MSVDKKLVQFAAKVKRNENEFIISVPASALEKISVTEGDDVIVEIRKYLTHIEHQGRK